MRSLLALFLSSVLALWMVLKRTTFAGVVRLVVKFYFLVLSLAALAALLGVLIIIGERLTRTTLAGGNLVMFDTSWIGPTIQSADAARDYVNAKIENSKARRQARRDTQTMWNREDTAVQRRVADARAAGVHPLFALGGALGGGSPIISNTTERLPSMASGADWSRAFTGKAERQTHEAALRESEARTKLMNAQADDIVQQQLDKSNQVRAVGRANSQQDILKVPAQAKEYVLPREGSGPSYSPFRPRGEKGWVTSRSLTAQQAEDEYGEISDWTYGPYRALHDWIWYNEGWKYFVPHAVTQGVFRDNPPRK